MHFIYASIAIILLAFLWLIQGNFKETFSNLKKSKPLLLWILFFLLHVTSYFYSHNKDQSLFDIQSKLSFLILPIIIGANNAIDTNRIEHIFTAFIAGVSLTAIYCLIKAFYLWQTSHDIDVFFYHKLVVGLDANAVYESWYSIFSITLLLFFNYKYYFIHKFKWLRILAISLLLIFFILLSSKSLIALFLFLIIPQYLIKIYKNHKISAGQIFSISLVTIVLIVLLAIKPNPIRQRYMDVLDSKVDKAWLKDYRGTDQQFSNLSMRLFLWRIGMENIKDKKLWWKGIGNGDVATIQNEKISQYGLDSSEKSLLHNINLHNMFLQSLIMLGIIGLSVFILIVFAPFLYINKIEYKKEFIIFNISSILFMVQEAALQTHAGIVYYTFFSCLYWRLIYSESTNKKNELNVKGI